MSRGGPTVMWNHRMVAHRPKRNDREWASCGPRVSWPHLPSQEGTLFAALRFGVRPCRQPACDLADSAAKLTPARSSTKARQGVRRGAAVTVTALLGAVGWWV